MSRDLFDLVRELNTLNDDNLADRVIANSDVQWCLSELQDILEEMPTLTPHIDRDSWDTCSECENKNCDNCGYYDYLSCIEPCRSCENASGWKPIQNFCGECGRPLTEESWAMLEKRLRG